MSNRKYFGTDGIRGRVGDAPITPDFVLKLGWAAGKVLARHGSRKIIIGKDTRISGYMLESALEAGSGGSGPFRTLHWPDANTGRGLSDAYLPRRGRNCDICIA
ncbi:phosphoglucosamine mutase [Escherichia coli]|uniref:Phosphoglucosamine mutase n=1 Tax=Escherichia coli TaxID=562 RepID=A0A2X1LC81_ECOLX|nr:phosphoglucosamine mutase [Escherichia coli]